MPIFKIIESIHKVQEESDFSPEFLSALLEKLKFCKLVKETKGLTLRAAGLIALFILQIPCIRVVRYEKNRTARSLQDENCFGNGATHRGLRKLCEECHIICLFNISTNIFKRIFCYISFERA